jgi:hypothetical protein
MKLLEKKILCVGTAVRLLLFGLNINMSGSHPILIFRRVTKMKNLNFLEIGARKVPQRLYGSAWDNWSSSHRIFFRNFYLDFGYSNQVNHIEPEAFRGLSNLK